MDTYTPKWSQNGISLPRLQVVLFALSLECSLEAGGAELGQLPAVTKCRHKGERGCLHFVAQGQRGCTFRNARDVTVRNYDDEQSNFEIRPTGFLFLFQELCITFNRKMFLLEP